MSTSFFLPAIAPFRLDFTVWALRRTQSNLIDQWDGKNYTRVFFLENKVVKVTIRQPMDKAQLGILVTTNICLTPRAQNKLSIILNNMLGLSLNMKGFYRFAKNDPHLRSSAVKFRGLKPPRFPSLFETLCNAIACQQFSIEAGLQILNRFIVNFGRCVQHRCSIDYAFPCPEDIVKCHPLALRKLGFSLSKSKNIIAIAKNMVCNEALWNNLENLSDQEVMKFLCSLKGIGRWSAEYTLLRGLGRIHFFPGDDVGAKKSLQKFLRLRDTLNYNSVIQITSSWSPYAGFIYFHLLLQKLAEKK